MKDCKIVKRELVNQQTGSLETHEQRKLDERPIFHVNDMTYKSTRPQKDKALRRPY